MKSMLNERNKHLLRFADSALSVAKQSIFAVKLLCTDKKDIEKLENAIFYIEDTKAILSTMLE